MKKVKNIFNSDTYSLTRSPEQYNVVFITEKNFTNKSDFEGGIVLFDGMRFHNQEAIDPFFGDRMT